MTIAWPMVHLEILFVDNEVGLRFLLFEGSLKQAVAFVFQVLTLFYRPIEQWKFADLQLPVTSIRFKFSCSQDFRKQIVFAFYNFHEVKHSKWMFLDSRLQRHCLLDRQLPLSECTYDNIKALQNGTNQLLSSPASSNSSSLEVCHFSMLFCYWNLRGDFCVCVILVIIVFSWKNIFYLLLFPPAKKKEKRRRNPCPQMTLFSFTFPVLFFS